MKERSLSAAAAAVGVALMTLAGIQGAAEASSVYEASYWMEGRGVVYSWGREEVLHQGSYDDSGELSKWGTSDSLSLGGGWQIQSIQQDRAHVRGVLRLSGEQ